MQLLQPLHGLRQFVRGDLGRMVEYLAAAFKKPDWE